MDDEHVRLSRAWTRLFVLLEDERYKYFIQGMLMGGHDAEDVEWMIEKALQLEEDIEAARARRADGGM